MKLLSYLFVIIFFITSCTCINEEQNYDESNNDTTKMINPTIVIEVNDIIILPELEGIEIFLENNSCQPIKVWENVNPSGFLDISFLVETESNEKLLIEPICLNWKSEFSKVVEIKPNKKFKLNAQLTHWAFNNSKIEETDSTFEGKIKAFYTVKESPEKESNFWTGEISSNEVQVIFKHNKFVKTARHK